jgi:hypothetical protein
MPVTFIPAPLLNVGVGVLIVKVEPVVGVTAVMPLPVIVGTGEAGIDTVFPPVIDNEFPNIDNEGVELIVYDG